MLITRRRWSLRGRRGRIRRMFPSCRHRWASRKRLWWLQELPGVWPGGRFLVVDIGDDRQADEQGRLLRLVVDHLDAYRQPLDDLHEVARGVLRRQQGEGLTGPHGKTRDAALE